MLEPNYDYNDGRDGRIRRFKETRAWLWECYGPGAELDYVVLTPRAVGVDGQCQIQTQERWAWDTREQHLRLYLKGDDELSLVKLKWL
jgi:hypothetical protein